MNIGKAHTFSAKNKLVFTIGTAKDCDWQLPVDETEPDKFKKVHCLVGFDPKVGWYIQGNDGGDVYLYFKNLIEHS